MNEILPPLAVCGLLMPLEAALLPYLHLSTARADLPLCGVLWLAVGAASTLEGALGSFLIGLLADLLSPLHPGLFTLVALVLYIFLRLTPIGRDIRGAASFTVLAVVGVGLNAFLVFGLLWAVGQPLPAAPLWPIAEGALFTAAAAPLFYWLSGLTGRLLVRDDPSLLR